MTEPDDATRGSPEDAGPVTPYLQKFQKEMNAGTVSLVLLAVLDHAGRPMYGYEIAKTLESAANGGSTVKQGTLYPVLRSLERSGLLESTVEPSVSGPPRRYYSVTDVGREGLMDWKEIWGHTRDFVDAVLEGKHLD